MMAAGTELGLWRPLSFLSSGPGWRRGLALWALPLLAIIMLGLPGGSLTDAQGGWALPAVAAQEEEQKSSRRNVRRTPALSNKVYEQIAKIQEKLDEEKLDEAAKGLDKMLARSERLNSYELANVWNYYAFVHYARDDYKRALNAYQQVAAQKDIPEGMEMNARYSVAQLYFVLEDYRSGVRALEDWLGRVENPGPSPHVLLAQGYFQLRRYERSLASILKAMDMARERELEVRESWFVLLRALYYEQENIPKVAEVLEEMIRRFSKKEYWLQLASMYGELGREKDQLAVMEAAYQHGWLDKESELRNLAYMYLAADVPYKAARVLERALKNKQMENSAKNLSLLGGAWRRAQERDMAVEVLEKAAAASDSGKIYMQLANAYLEADHFAKAAVAVRRALDKGGLDSPDRAHLLLGMSLFNADQLDEAGKAFAKAAESSDEQERTRAERWQEFLERERFRRDQLQEDLQPAPTAG